MNNGFIKASLISPKLEVGNPSFNVKEILRILKTINSDIALFPELAITSYSCQDLFLFDELREENDKALRLLLNENSFKGLLVVGGIFSFKSALFNVAYIIQGNKILGIVPKYYLPNYQEFMETRWFTPGINAKNIKEVEFDSVKIPFGDIIFKCKNSKYLFGVGVEICEDIWAPISPSNLMSVNGANVFLNLSSSTDFLFKDKRRVNMVQEASRKNRGAYLYTSSNSSESSTNVVFGSSQIASVCGELLISSNDFSTETKINEATIDLQTIDYMRKKDSSYKESLSEFLKEYKTVEFTLDEKEEKNYLNKTPFKMNKEDKDDFKKVYDLQKAVINKEIELNSKPKIILDLKDDIETLYSLKLLVDNFDKNILIFTSLEKLDNSIINKYLELKGLSVIKINSINEYIDLINKENALSIGKINLTNLAVGSLNEFDNLKENLNIISSLPKTMIISMVEDYLEDELKDLFKNYDMTLKDQVLDFTIYRFLKEGDSKDRIAKLLVDNFDIDSLNAKEYVDNFYNKFIESQAIRNRISNTIKASSVSLDSRLDFRMSSDVKRK